MIFFFPTKKGWKEENNKLEGAAEWEKKEMERQRLVLIDPVLVVEGVQMKMAFVDSVNRFPPLFFLLF